MNHIFFSYQRESEAAVKALAETLQSRDWMKQANLDIWQDLSGKDTGIPYSVKWWEVIRGALYGAAGALIIKTEPWTRSGPCSREYTLILANRVPHLTIEEPELAEENREALLEKIRTWVCDEVDTEANRHRTWLFTQSYRMRQDRHVAHLLPKTRGFRNAAKQYREYAARTRYLKESGIEQSRPSAGKRMANFLRMGKRKIIRDQVFRVLVILGAVAGVIMLGAAIRMLPNLLIDSSNADYRGKTTAAMDMLKDTAEYDPVSSISMMTNDPVARNFNEYRAFFFMQQTMTGLLSRHYPVAFHAAGSAEATAAQAAESAEYPVTPDPVRGTAATLIRGQETSLTVNCAPQASCYVPERNELIIAADRRVLAFDLDGSREGILLDFNFEAVDRITVRDNLICAVSEKGNVICWENPVPVKTVRRELSSGVLMPGGGAVYAADEGLILQRGGAETVCPLPFACSGIIALSADGQTAAAAGADDTGSQQVALVSTDSGKILSVFGVPAEMWNMAFSLDGSRLYGVNLGMLVCIDLGSGQVWYTPAEDSWKYYNVAACQDHIVVARTDGMIAEFGKDLRRTGNWTEITAGHVAPKQLAVSHAGGTVFAACRGGNTIAGCMRVTLSSGAIHRLAQEGQSGMTASNCVAVSEDGNFAAFGFPNGKITVWDTENLNQLFECRPVAEPLVSLRFEGDGLYLLGQSGTVYRTEFEGLVRKVEWETLSQYWQAYQEKAAGIHRRMFELGLTYINP